MEMDKITLEFSDEALREIAKLSIERKSGARGLRAIMEKLLIPIMYDAASRKDIEKITIDKNCVLNGEPVLKLKA